MPRPNRRDFVGGAVAAASGLLLGSDGTRAQVGTAPSPQASPLSSPPPPSPAAAVDLQTRPKSRAAQRYLFQSVPAKFIGKRLASGVDYLWDHFGPTHAYVDFHTGWLWQRPGGDWLDAKQVRHGKEPWCVIASDKASGATAVASYSGDVTAAVQFVQTQNRWCAFLLVAENAPRALAGPFHPSQAAPAIDVAYADGSKARLACRIVAVNSTSSSGPITTAEQVALPAFVEFERPLPLTSSAVVAAEISFVLTEHWSGNNANLLGYLLDPPVNADPPRLGLAANAGRLDAQIEALDGVIGAHRYLDGLPLSRFVHDGESNHSAERLYDPAVFDNGASDVSKFPHAGLGQWVNAGPNWSLVTSKYKADGFVPLAPGLGALRVPMPAQVQRDGAVVGYSGTLAGNAMIFLPEPMFGRLGRIFVRYYFRLAGPYRATSNKRFHVYQSGTTAEWTTMAGKWGIGPDHSTSTGGVSGSSGGGHGWQMRNSWYDCDANVGGPDEGGWAAGFHLYDFSYQNPRGHNHGRDQPVPFERWGQLGGAGGLLYANEWYCVETELKLNSVTAPVSNGAPNAASATSTAAAKPTANDAVSPLGPSFSPDGELRAWIDGRLVFERTGLVFRTMPIVPQPYQPNRLRACRELGVRGLWLNWFHGGKTQSSMDRTSFYTGLVWSTDYIGPMNLTAAPAVAAAVAAATGPGLK
jgi:hypothetical protein